MFESVIEFFKRYKPKDKKALHAALVEHYSAPVQTSAPVSSSVAVAPTPVRIPHHQDEDFDSVLPTILTMEMLSGGFDQHIVWSKWPLF